MGAGDGIRMRGTAGLIHLVATGAGDGGAIANAVLAHTLSPGKSAIIRRIMAFNRIGVNADILVGYGDRTVAGSLFRQVGTRLLCVAGVDSEWNETDLPIMGNMPQGFQADSVIPTGTIGDIYIETDSAAVGAAPGDIQVMIEVEEF